jgi:hypothetical protein
MKLNMTQEIERGERPGGSHEAVGRNRKTNDTAARNQNNKVEQQISPANE